MRNLNNSLLKITKHKGPLTRALVCYTAKQTINQFHMGWLTPIKEEPRLSGSYVFQGFVEATLKGRKLDKDLTERGLKWMKQYFFTAKGESRKTKALKYVPKECFEIIKNFSHYTFEGFHDQTYGNHAQVEPIWGVHARDGRSFHYCYTGGMYKNNIDPLEITYLNTIKKRGK